MQSTKCPVECKCPIGGYTRGSKDSPWLYKENARPRMWTAPTSLAGNAMRHSKTRWNVLTVRWQHGDHQSHTLRSTSSEVIWRRNQVSVILNVSSMTWCQIPTVLSPLHESPFCLTPCRRPTLLVSHHAWQQLYCLMVHRCFYMPEQK